MRIGSSQTDTRVDQSRSGEGTVPRIEIATGSGSGSGSGEQV